MAYIKYKELTKYFNFNEEIPTDNLPKYVNDFVNSDETLIGAYKTSRDKGIFTDKKMILFDLPPLTDEKKIHIIPYSSISSGAIVFNSSSAEILLSLDSGYQMRLDFVRLGAEEKTRLRIIFTEMLTKADKKNK
ncbi:MAG: PH domain-containing protein [Bacilli bacterium]